MENNTETSQFFSFSDFVHIFPKENNNIMAENLFPWTSFNWEDDFNNYYKFQEPQRSWGGQLFENTNTHNSFNWGRAKEKPDSLGTNNYYLKQNLKDEESLSWMKNNSNIDDSTDSLIWNNRSERGSDNSFELLTNYKNTTDDEGTSISSSLKKRIRFSKKNDKGTYSLDINFSFDDWSFTSFISLLWIFLLFSLNLRS